MADKQILASLQIESNEVRLVVGEFFNTRLNILYKETAPCKGLEGIRIVEKKAVARAINEVVNNATAHLGVPVKSVLLAIPAYRFKRDTKSFSRVIESGDRKAKAADFKDIYQRALGVNVGSDLIIVNATSNSYRTNGITYRKMPLDEQCDVLEADVDLLCCDKMTTYDYAEVVEMAGLKILDIYLDNYAACKEAALFEQAMRSYLLAIQLEKDHTLFSIIYDGKILSAENENIGYSYLAQPLKEKYGLPEKNSLRLLQKYIRLDQNKFNDRPAYSYTINQTSNMLTDRELAETVQPAAAALIADFRNLCEPILAQDNVAVMVCGEGAEIQGIDGILSREFRKPVKCYLPETLGVRAARYTVPLGMFYAYIDQQEVINSGQNSVDIAKYESHLQANVNHEIHEEGFTARLRKMLFTNQKNS